MIGEEYKMNKVIVDNCIISRDKRYGEVMKI
jgi:hypothetical protein